VDAGLSVVAPSVWSMPVMIEQGQVQAPGAGDRDLDTPLDTPLDTERPVSREPGSTRAESCACDECEAPARDEMWTRWA
jgi:hypothetical protein